MERVYRSIDNQIFEDEKECRQYEKELYQNLPKILNGIKEYCRDYGDCSDCAFWDEDIDCCKFSEKDLNYPANWKNPED